MLYMLIQLILLRVVLITSGRVRMYYMIIMLKFVETEANVETEAEVKLVRNCYYKIAYIQCVIERRAKRFFNLRLSTLYVYVVYTYGTDRH